MRAYSQMSKSLKPIIEAIQPLTERKTAPDRASQPSVLRNSYVKPLSTIQNMVAHASVSGFKPNVELHSHADTCVVNDLVYDNCLVIHNHNRPVNVYSFDPKDGHRSTKTVDAAVGYQNPQSGKKLS